MTGMNPINTPLPATQIDLARGLCRHRIGLVSEPVPAELLGDAG